MLFSLKILKTNKIFGTTAERLLNSFLKTFQLGCLNCVLLVQSPEKRSRTLFRKFFLFSFFRHFWRVFWSDGQNIFEKKCQKNFQRHLRSSSMVFFGEIVLEFFVALRAKVFGPFAESFRPGCENCIQLVKSNVLSYLW